MRVDQGRRPAAIMRAAAAFSSLVLAACETHAGQRTPLESFALDPSFQAIPGLPALPGGWTLSKRARPGTESFEAAPVYLDESAPLALFGCARESASLTLQSAGDAYRPLAREEAGSSIEYYGVRAVPDCDGDGRDDVLVRLYSPTTRAYGIRVVSSASGHTLVERRNPEDTQSSASFIDAAIGQQHQVEFAVSSVWRPRADTAPLAGTVEVLTLPNFESRLLMFEQQAGGAFGWRVRWGGDWDGDGVDDLFVSSPERARETGAQGCIELFSGRDGQRLRSWNVADFGLTLPLSRTYGFGADMVPLADAGKKGSFMMAVSFEGTFALSGFRPGGYQPLVYVLDFRDSKVISKCSFDVGDEYDFAVQPDLVAIPDCDGDGLEDVLIVCGGFALVRANGSGEQVGSASFVSSATGRLLAGFRGTDEGKHHVGWSVASTRRGRRQAVSWETTSDTWILERE